MKCKKILVVIPHLVIGGTEVQTLNLVKALTEGGYTVIVLCLFRHVESMVTQYESVGAKICFASPQYDRYGIDIDYPKRLRLVKFLYKHLRRVIREEEIDVVHVQYMTPATTMILILRYLLFQRNIIATVHTAADIYKDLRLIYFIQRHCLRAFTCITERAERSFFGTSQLYTPETVLGKRNHFTIYNALPFRYSERLKVIGEGLEVKGEDHPDGNSKTSTLNSKQTNLTQTAQESSALTTHCSPLIADGQQTTDDRQRTPSGVSTEGSQLTAHSSQSQSSSQKEPSASFVLGVVSRLERIKGMDLVVPAFAEVLKVHPDTQLLVVGDGSLRASMEQQATELGCADHITWVGRQPQEELSQWYSQMDIVLMPSRSEGFGLTAIEAMSHGCVMVASDVGGLPEVVRDGICGLLHRTEDVADMAAKICTLIGDNDLYNKLRAQSLVEVEKYSFERYAELIHNLYGKL